MSDLIQILEFYANEDNWLDKINDENYTDKTVIEVDSGALAREFLDNDKLLKISKWAVNVMEYYAYSNLSVYGDNGQHAKSLLRRLKKESSG